MLEINSDVKIVVEGHADERGMRENNLVPGGKRVNAIKAYLMTHKIPQDRIKVTNYSNERAVNSGSSPLDWSKNKKTITVIFI